ncbi:unnamed protein product [Agarophyton chilense]|eukprot:gb/GEZJ01005460.1/.p1 GENE.gb/GEZJ01005460.1/~~gb/GEZJ01005460.1/.p1  ORF type:complete len:405 (-),score=48.85 gb/GEZJ01005460.1/:92-1306(-)
MTPLTIRLFVLIVCASLAFAQTERPDDDVEPAPPSIGSDVPLTYFGPAPSQVDPRLIGPVQLLKSGVIDFDEGTITIPLYKGRYYDNTTHYYILTDTTDPANAAALGLNHASKLEYVTPESGATADLSPSGILVNRTGKVDFSPVRILEPGPDSAPFPPVEFGPPQVGDEQYSPYVRILNAGSRLYNAPIVASGINSDALDEYCEGIPENNTEAYEYIHSKVVAICPGEATVTVKLTPGFSFSKPVLYLSMDASSELPAAMEDTTHAPRLEALLVGTDDSAFSPVERLFAVTNGFTNRDLAPGAPQNETVHPSRQGFFSALFEEGSPLNVLGGIPTVATDYSPAWDLNVGEWTPYSVENGIRDRLIEEFQVLGFVQRGYMTGPGGSPYGSSGFIVNCPIVHRFL